jgi:hypothetical protein
MRTTKLDYELFTTVSFEKFKEMSIVQITIPCTTRMVLNVVQLA